MSAAPETDGSRGSAAGPPRRRRPSSAATVLLSILFLVFVAGGIFSGCLFLSNVASIFASTSTGRVPEPTSTVPAGVVATNPRATPQQAPQPTAEPAPGWQGNERLTILLLGLDQRPDQVGQPARSDTMIILTVDPATKRAGMISIPRDLWVPIPGHGENKINTAHFYGEADQPGTGPALAKKTVEYNFGIHVNYYARVDFHGFEQLIDALGGITVDAERPVKDDEYPSEDYGINRVYIPAGLQRMDGITALRYARSRHSDNDFGRNHRQMEVLIAARNEALQPSILPKLPQMIGILSQALSTDVPVRDLLPLANLARSVKTSDIISRSIDYSMVQDVNGDGTVLLPIRDKIRPIFDEVFGSTPPSPTPQPTRTPEPTRTPLPTATPQPTSASSLRVQVLNGTTRDGFAAATADELRARGYVVTNVAQAARSDYAATAILSHTGRQDDAIKLASLLGVPEKAVRSQAGDGTCDVTVILGLDARSP